nr:protein Daple-like [Ipomoea batatas]
MSGYFFVTSLPSLIKNWKEKFVYVSYNPRAAGYGFSTAWVQFVAPFTTPSYEGLDADRAKLCRDGPSDHRRYHDPLLVNQLSDGPPLRHSGTSRPRTLRPYHPDHIDFIRRGVRKMVPAPTRFWIDSSPMDALSSHLVGDLMNEASQDYAASEEALRELGERHQQLQGEHEKQLVAHTRALEHAIEDWQGTEDFSRAADDYACSHIPGLLRYWLSSPDRSGQAMVDAISGWHDAQDYQAYLGPPLVQVLQEWAVTAGGKSAMRPVAEVWLRDTDEVHARVVRGCEAAFYLGQREMHGQLYGKLRRRFTSISITGWKLLEYLPLRRPHYHPGRRISYEPRESRGDIICGLTVGSGRRLRCRWECGSVFESPFHIRVWFFRVSSKFYSSVGIIFQHFPVFL